MKSVFLPGLICSTLLGLAYQFRGELNLPAPIDLFVEGTGLFEEAGLGKQPGQRFVWPPRLGEPYPDLELLDQDGNLTKLADFRGQIILIEPIGMPCAACQAFCGGHELGGLGGVTPQRGLPSMRQLAADFGGFNLADDRVVKVYLVLYNQRMQAPSVNDLRAWADHFGLDRSRNEIVLAGLPSMLGQASYKMIPGLQLIDRDFVFRYDATGRTRPRHDLYRELLPAVGKLLND